MANRISNLERQDVCVIGLGPAGLGAALTFIKSNSSLKITCLERGLSPTERSFNLITDDRVCKRDRPCDIISGFGGCSLISGGKISQLPAGSGLKNIFDSDDLAERKMNQAYQTLKNYIPIKETDIAKEAIKHEKEYFQKKNFNYKYYDAHIIDQKKEKLNKKFRDLYNLINNSKINVCLDSEVKDLEKKKNGYDLKIKKGNEIFNICTDSVVMAVGKSGSDLLEKLNSKFGFGVKKSKLEFGIRLEFPTNYRSKPKILHNDLKLVFDSARTFCVCEGGKIVSYYQDGTNFLEGHRNNAKLTPLTNLGIRIRKKPSSDNEKIYEKIKNQMKNVTRGKPLRQLLSDFLEEKKTPKTVLKNRDTTLHTWKSEDINRVYPEKFANAIRNSTEFFTLRFFHDQRNREKINVFAPELYYPRYQFDLKPDFSISSDIYIVGECTGRFRGILQSFCSGIVCAQNIISRDVK